MKRGGLFLIVAVAAMISVVTARISYAGEVDILVRKLVEKGILTPGEAAEIAAVAKKEATEETKQMREEKTTSLPQWAQNMKVKGDFRLRYQGEKRKASTERHRGRMRLRVGVEAEPTDKVKVGFGLASGSDGDPRSTNQTFQDSFAKKPVWIDYAYAHYEAFPWMTLIGGRMKNPVWEPGDLLWDTDINPEGIAIKLDHKITSSLEAFLNESFFILDESSADKNDPFVLVTQPGLAWEATDKIKVKGAYSIYSFNQTKGRAYDWTGSTNTRTSTGANVLAYNYDTHGPSIAIDFAEPISILPIETAGLFAEYITNPHVQKDNDGFLAGMKFGSRKVAKRGDWQAKYMYRRLEKDAWLDFLPDSDSYSGRTGIRGHELAFEYGLLDNVIFGLDYYHTKNIASVEASERPENLLQADAVFKF